MRLRDYSHGRQLLQASSSLITSQAGMWRATVACQVVTHLHKQTFMPKYLDRQV